MEERLESRNRAIGQLGDMFDREINLCQGMWWICLS